MITSETITAILAGVGALIGSGGVTAIIHELSIRKKMATDTDIAKSENTTELMKYFTEEIKRINDNTTEQLNRIQEENDLLKKEVASLTSKINDLVQWIAYDNNKYRTWLEEKLKTFDPEIEFPECVPPPNFRVDESSDNEH